MPDDKPLRILVASAVYGVEHLLDQVFSTLEGYGYEVWMSHKGTIPTDPRLSNFENCLLAVDASDLFLGIITGRYGSGQDARRPSILHQEVRRAIEKNKLRWFLAHHNVTVARQLLKQFRFRSDGMKRRCRFEPTAVLEDLRILDMYDEAILQDVPLSRRRAHWAQPFFTDEDALRFLKSTFSDIARARKIVAEEEANA